MLCASLTDGQNGDIKKQKRGAYFKLAVMVETYLSLK